MSAPSAPPRGPAPVRLSLGDLEVGPAVGSGSQGSIHHVTRPVPGFDGTIIYKRFAARTTVAGTTLERLAAYRAGLDEPERRALDAFTVWPSAVVADGGRIVGYLMQEIPAPFLQVIETTTGTERIPREIQHLFVSDELARRNLGEAPTRAERLVLARSMAFGLGFLHAQGFVYGDLSYKNAVYTLRPEPRILLLDCDGVRREGEGAAVAQLNSPGWAAPEGGPQTKQTDRYKLGLFVLRCLTPGVNAQNRDPDKAAGRLDADGMAMLRRALGDDPANRPSGKEWVEHLDRELARVGAPARRGGAAPRPSRAHVPKRGPAPTRSPRGQRVGSAVLAGAAAPMALRPLPASTHWSPLHTSRTAVPPAWPPSAVPASGSAPVASLRLILVFFLVGISIVTMLATAGSSSRSPFGATSTTRRGTSSTVPKTSVVPYLTTTTVPSTSSTEGSTSPVRLADGVAAAERQVTAALGPLGQLVAVSTTGALGVDVAPPAVPVLGAPSPQWVFQYLVAATPTRLGTEAVVRTVAVGPAGVVDQGTTTVAFPGQANLETMSAAWPTSLERAARRVLTAERLTEPVRVSWVCDPAPGEADCRWAFHFGAAGDDLAFVNTAGDTLTPRPSWYRDGLG